MCVRVRVCVCVCVCVYPLSELGHQVAVFAKIAADPAGLSLSDFCGDKDRAVSNDTLRICN